MQQNLMLYKIRPQKKLLKHLIIIFTNSNLNSVNSPSLSYVINKNSSQVIMFYSHFSQEQRVIYSNIYITFPSKALLIGLNIKILAEITSC